MSKKFDFTNDKVNIADYNLKDEDIYNLAKYGQEHVSDNVKLSAADMLTDILKDCNNRFSSYEAQFFIVMLSDLFDDKNNVAAPTRQKLVKIIDTFGYFSLKNWIKIEKKMGVPLQYPDMCRTKVKNSTN